MRPRCEAARRPGHLIPTTSVKADPVAYRGHVSVKPGPSLRACGARPSAGGKPSWDGLPGKTLR